ncbi:hypothetical protein [Synechocystis sp. PCC 7509]|uniref:hypothetical protein n=1 Tax=Synechocystis sp. PCC 7509 TaxID=927677 RepID=UPI0002AC72A8|nr:hypothetical protein [Synechocystis sp. PCC 7509]
MIDNDVATELIQALTRAEIEFGLSKMLQTQGIQTNEPITVKFKWGDETLLHCQRELDSSSSLCYWDQANGSNIEVLEQIKLNETIGQEIVEIFSKAEMLPTFKSILLKRDVTISEEHPVIVEFKINDVGMMALRCPCLPKPCCQVSI